MFIKDLKKVFLPPDESIKSKEGFEASQIIKVPEEPLENKILAKVLICYCVKYTKGVAEKCPLLLSNIEISSRSVYLNI